MFLRIIKFFFILFTIHIPLSHGSVVTPATKTKYETLQTLIQTNQLIVIGMLISKNSYYTEDHQLSDEIRFIATDHQIRVEKILKGDPESDEIIVKLPGGCIEHDDVCYKSDIIPEINEGEKIILFLKPEQNGKWYIWDLLYGKQVLKGNLFYPLGLSLDEIEKWIQQNNL